MATDVGSRVRTRARRRPARSGALSWQLSTAPRRLAGRWRILGAVGGVALLATTLVCSLAMLVSAAEGRSVRAALTAEPERSTFTVVAEQLDVPGGAVQGVVGAELADRLGVPLRTDVVAQSQLYDVPRPGVRSALAYLAEPGELADDAVLVDGEWPEPWADDATGEPVPVAVPVPALEVLGTGLGSTHDLGSRVDGVDLTVRVVGVYDVPRLGASWSWDRMRGALHNPVFPLPEFSGRVSTDAVGPFVVGDGALDGAGGDVYRLVLRYTPDLSGLEAADLTQLRQRLVSVDTGLTRAVEDRADRIRTSSTLPALVDDVATHVVVARAGVAVVGLLLLVLAVAALLQTARLLAEARHDEHDLMRARGASRRQLVVGAVLEVAPLVALVALASPLLAPLVLRALGAATGLVPLVGGPSTPTWLVAAGVALTLGLVLVLPLVRAPDTFVEAQQARARPGRRAVLARSGLDVLMLVLGGLAYWQLSLYRSPFKGSGGSLDVDPVLVAGPVVVLLAGALLCLRLLPFAARLAERLAARGRGVVGPLAAWEVGRRTPRATSAVLLLTIALAVTAFSQTFLATWQQSQTDQTWYERGAPVVAEPVPGAEAYQVARLAHPDAGPAQPVLGERGTVWPGVTSAVTTRRPHGGSNVAVQALTDEARAVLDRGRVAREGGGAVAALASGAVPFEHGVDLGEDAVGLSATLGFASLEGRDGGVLAAVRVLLADGTGVVRTADLGRVLLDDPAGPVEVRVPLDDPSVDPGLRTGPLRLVGVTAALEQDMNGALPGTVVARLTVEDLGVLRHDGPLGETPREGTARLADLEPDPLDTAPTDGWTSLAVGAAVESRGGSPLTSWLSFRGDSVQQGVVTVRHTAWQPNEVLPAVVTRTVAEELDVTVGRRLLLGVGDTYVDLEVRGVADRVPSVPDARAVVVDARALSRAVAERHAAPPPVTAWWVDVADDDVGAYLAALAERPPEIDGQALVDRVSATALDAEDRRSGPVRAPVPAALWLATAGAALVAALGFAVHTVVTVRSREVEVAQLRAIGLERRRVGAVVAVEALLLSAVGVVLGTGTGLLLVRLVGPLVATSSDGRPPVPAVQLVVPWAALATASAGVVALVLLVVLAVVRVLRTAEPGFVLRAEAGR